MAEYCNQCAAKWFGGITDEDVKRDPILFIGLAHAGGDFAGITTPEEAANNLYALVLCEGCGPCQPDPEGNCINSKCFEKHGKQQ